MKIPARAVDSSTPWLDRARVAAFLELTKPRLTMLAVIAAVSGYTLASGDGARVAPVLGTLFGAFLVGGGANALNQLAERDLDRLMDRTRARPLPSGRLEPVEALAFGTLLAAMGVALLAFTTTATTVGIAAAILVSYVAVYTPLKRWTAWNTPVGAVPGALPVLLGWSAAGRPLDAAAWSLFAVVFLWQLPHFFAICWYYRDDYRRAGYAMTPLSDPGGRRTGWWTMILSTALIPLSLMPAVLGVTGPWHAAWAVGLGSAYAAAALPMVVRPSDATARFSFLVSIAYLPLLMASMMLTQSGSAG